MKKVLGVLINDVHLDKYNGELVKDIFNQLINVCKEYHTHRIFCGGDVFTNRSGQPLQCLTDWKEILELLTENRLDFHVIPGNHDKTAADSNKSYLDIFGEDCVHLYRTAGYVYIDNCIVAFIPFFQDERWLAEFNQLEDEVDDKRAKNAVTILITHIGFDGVINNDGSVVKSMLKPTLFKKWTKVLIGHYHNASKIANNIFYTGSAYQNNYGETINDKGFTVIYNDGSIKHVPSHFPKYIKETIDANDKEMLRKMVQKYDGEKYDHVRFIFSGSKNDCQKINIGEIQGKLGIDCKFQCTEESNAIKLAEKDIVFEYDEKTILKDFMTFCNENSIKGNKLKYGVELIKNRKNVESD